jgi:hypothetical protein
LETNTIQAKAEDTFNESLQALGLSKQENHLLGLYKTRTKDAYASIQYGYYPSKN